MRDRAEPTLADVLEARRRIARTCSRRRSSATPRSTRCSGHEALVKHENHQPVGAFKVRGGINLLSQLPRKSGERGLIAGVQGGTTGSRSRTPRRLFGVPARLRPRGRESGEGRSMRGLAAELVVHGSRLRRGPGGLRGARREHGDRYIHSGTSRC